MMVAELFMQNPAFATELIHRNCIGGHGSKSGSFFDVMNTGLRPRQDLAIRGISVTTGEAVYGSTGLNQEYLSCAQWTDISTLKHYANLGMKGHVSLAKLSVMQEKTKQLIKKSIGSIYESATREGLKDLENTVALLEKTPETDADRLRQYFSRANFPVIYMIGGDWKNEYDPEQLENTSALKVRVPVSDVNSEFVVRGGVDVRNIQIILVLRKNFGDVGGFVDQVNASQGLDIQIFPLEDYQRLALDDKLYDVK